MPVNYSRGDSFLGKLSGTTSGRTSSWQLLIWKWSRITSESCSSRWLEQFNQASSLFLKPIIICFKDNITLAHEFFISHPQVEVGGGMATEFWKALLSWRDLQLPSLGSCSRNGTWVFLSWLGLPWAVQCMLRTNYSCVMELLEIWKEVKEKPPCSDAYHSSMVLPEI